MLQVFAEEYISIGRVFQFWEGVENPPEDKLSLKHFDEFRSALEGLARSCGAVNLITSRKLVANALVKLSPEIKYKEACVQMGSLREVVEADIESRVFVHIPPERTDYLVFYEKDQFGKHNKASLGKELERFEPVFELFPSCRFDIEEAGNCFAAGRFTACVHHLSRAVEFGMTSLASYAAVEPKDQRNWNTAMNKAHANLREKKDGFASVIPQSQDEMYFSEAIGLLRNFNVAWRNPSSHAPEIFLEEKARGLFSIAQSTLNHLCRRLKEVPMPNA